MLILLSPFQHQFQKPKIISQCRKPSTGIHWFVYNPLHVTNSARMILGQDYIFHGLKKSCTLRLENYTKSHDLADFFFSRRNQGRNETIFHKFVVRLKVFKIFIGTLKIQFLWPISTRKWFVSCEICTICISNES